MQLRLLLNRLIAANGMLYDGSEPLAEEGVLLPCTDAQVRRDIDALLTKHNQRELPPVKPKKLTKKEKRHMKLTAEEKAISCKCGEPPLYNAEFDAYYCDPCNKWLEPKCGDQDCKFCPPRPKYPKPKEKRATKPKEKSHAERQS